MNQPRRKPFKTHEEYSATINAEGVMVRVCCLRIGAEPRARFEVRLEAAGQRAIVDLPISERSNLEHRIGQVARGFAVALRLRLRDDGMLP